MSQDSTIPNSNYHTMVVLGDAAWTLLANQPIDQIDIDAVADRACVDRGLAGAIAGSVQYLVLAKMSELDRQSLTETYGDIQDAGEVSIREKIIECLLHWSAQCLRKRFGRRLMACRQDFSVRSKHNAPCFGGREGSLGSRRYLVPLVFSEDRQHLQHRLIGRGIIHRDELDPAVDQRGDEGHRPCQPVEPRDEQHGPVAPTLCN